MCMVLGNGHHLNKSHLRSITKELPLTSVCVCVCVCVCLCLCLCVCVCLQSPSNQSFYRQIAGYGIDVDDHEVA